MRFKSYSCCILYILFLFACAKQSSPTGGPQDTIPPTVIRYIPENKSTQFTGRTLELTLNEYVQLKNPKEEIIINPSIGKDYKIEAKKNTIKLTSAVDLKDSTTYTVNFRDAVTDITEQNPARNLRVAISTGPYIDSLSITGSVKDVLEDKLAHDVTVGLQPYSDSFSIIKHPTTYFTKTDKNGNFSLENLKPGLYWISAIKDVNRNLIADTKSEAYAFKKDSLLLDGNKKGIILGLVKQDTRPLKITSTRPFGTYFNIKTSKNLMDYRIQADDSTDLYHTYGSDPTNIIIYNTLKSGDSSLVHLTVRDSIENRTDSSFYIKFREGTPDKFTFTVANSKLIGHARELSFDVIFSKPLKEINFDSIQFQIDSLTTLKFNQQEVDYTEENRTLKIKKIYAKGIFTKPPDAEGTDVPEAPSYLNNLKLGRTAFISVENDSSSQQTQKIPLQWEEDLGVILAETHGNQQVIIQLVGENLKVIRTAQGPKATFADLPPSNYLLRIIVDKNKNGKWDGGNYLKKIEPEEIIYYKTEKGERSIKLKENFEIGPLLITY
jgi:uncharacterized protein (DUF2141 family)